MFYYCLIILALYLFIDTNIGKHHVCPDQKRSPSRLAVQIFASKRVGDKVQQKVLRHVGTARNVKELEVLKKLGDTIKAESSIRQRKELRSFPKSDGSL